MGDDLLSPFSEEQVITLGPKDSAFIVRGDEDGDAIEFETYIPKQEDEETIFTTSLAAIDGGMYAIRMVRSRSQVGRIPTTFGSGDIGMA